MRIKRRRLALILLASFVIPQVTDYCASILPVFSSSPIACAAGEDAQPANANGEVEAYVQALKKKWGISEDSVVEVICTCKCCGDRCPMGAKCCCPSEKIPVETRHRLWLRGSGCFGLDGVGFSPPASSFWQFLTWKVESQLCLDCREAIPEDLTTSLRTGYGRLDPPPPKTI